MQIFHKVMFTYDTIIAVPITRICQISAFNATMTFFIAMQIGIKWSSYIFR